MARIAYARVRRSPDLAFDLHGYAVLVGEFLVDGRLLHLGIRGHPAKFFHHLNFELSDAMFSRPVGRPLLAGYECVPTI